MATTCVGCKLPNGLHLDYAGKRVTLNGANSAVIVGGHDITEGVDKEWFEAWLAAYKDNPAVVNGLVFAHEKRVNTEAEAKDRAKNKTGLEPVDQDKPAPGVVKATEKE